MGNSLGMPVDAVRRRVTDAVLSRVAGEHAHEQAGRVWLAPGPRWFTPEDAIWRIHADPSMFIGGLRALLLQSLHPLAMAGVAGHSGYRSDPWGRLQRTSAYMTVTTYGTIDDAEAAIAAVRTIHRRVRGRAEDGRPYRASDPDLLGWVHAAGVDSFLSAHRRHGLTVASGAEQDEYVRQSGSVAARLGVLNPPQSVDELTATLEAYRPALAGTKASRDTARFLLFEPPLSGVSRLGYASLSAAAVALLPVWAKEMLRLPALPVTDRLVSRPLGDATVRLINWAMGPRGSAAA